MTTQQKLLKLADFLENEVKDSWFALSSWATKGFTKKECGTTACAAGWATVCFPKSGLRLQPIGDVVGLNESHESQEMTIMGGPPAVRKFFGIDIDTYRHLFDQDSYPAGRDGRKNVVKRLREVANGLWDRS